MEFWQIGQIAKRSGHSIATLRYYEELGLITAIRSAGGTRKFVRSTIRRLGFISIAQNFGYPLNQIKEMLDQLPNDRNPTAKDWAKISSDFRADINNRIARLEIMRDKLDGCIGCGCLSMDRCALYNPNDHAGKGGAGPRFI